MDLKIGLLKVRGYAILLSIFFCCSLLDLFFVCCLVVLFEYGMDEVMMY